SLSRPIGCEVFCSVSPEKPRSTLTSILHTVKMQDTAHGDTFGAISQNEGDQTGAPRPGVGIQPPAPLTHSYGADGSDAQMHRGDRLGLPQALGRERPRNRPVRSGGGAIEENIAADQA